MESAYIMPSMASTLFCFLVQTVAHFLDDLFELVIIQVGDLNRALEGLNQPLVAPVAEIGVDPGEKTNLIFASLIMKSNRAQSYE